MCLTPYLKLDRQVGTHHTLPCGKCPACTSRRTSSWSFRLMQQDKISISSYFVTLTYDTDHVPITPKGYMSLCKRDLQLFFKRLRKNHGSTYGKQIKYYAVGEYGGKTKRPHYHIILFNANKELIEKSWSIDGVPIGTFHIGDVTGASVGYTLKYISKPQRIPEHVNDDRVKGFSLMSKGIGKNYITQQVKKWHTADLENRMYIPLEGGKKASMPRYYKDRIYDDIQRDAIKNHYRFKFQLTDEVKYSREYNAAIEAAIRKQINQQHKNDKL